MTQEDINKITYLGRLKEVLSSMVRTLEARPAQSVVGLKLEYESLATSIPDLLRGDTRDALLSHYRTRLEAVEAEIKSITVTYNKPQP